MCTHYIHTFPIMGCFAIVVLAYKVLKVSYKNTPGSPFYDSFWSLFGPFKGLFSSGTKLGNITFFALSARQIQVFFEMRKYVSNLLPHLKGILTDFIF